MATLNKIIRGQTVTDQIDLINKNISKINTDLEKVIDNEQGYITEESIPVKSVQGKTGNVTLNAKEIGAFPNSSSIGELDINNIKETGVYIGIYATNPYYLIVIKYNDTNIYQELIGNALKQYRRFTGTWSEWIKPYSKENPIKAGDISGIDIVDTNKELTLAMLEDTTFVKANIKYNPSTESLYIGENKFATEQFVRDAFNTIKTIIVQELPPEGIENTIYFVPSKTPDNSNAFEEYIYVDGTWEIVGGTAINLTPFLPREEAENTYAKISSLDEKVSKTTTINGKTLYSNITLTAEDVGALPKDTILVEDVVYKHTNEEINGKLIAGAFIENDVVVCIDDGIYLKGHIYKYNSGVLSDITDIINDYVNLSDNQNINGIKNFTGILRYGGVNVLTEDDLEDIENKIPNVDTTLSENSNNPVENQAITKELQKKADITFIEENYVEKNDVVYKFSKEEYEKNLNLIEVTENRSGQEIPAYGYLITANLSLKANITYTFSFYTSETINSNRLYFNEDYFENSYFSTDNKYITDTIPANSTYSVQITPSVDINIYNDTILKCTYSAIYQISNIMVTEGTALLPYQPYNVDYPKNELGQTTHGDGDRVVETYISSDGSIWYRRWKSGWKECGGLFANYQTVNPNSDSVFYVTLPIEFESDWYVANATTRWYASKGGLAHCYIYSPEKTNTTLPVVFQNNTDETIPSGATGAYWYCCGY